MAKTDRKTGNNPTIVIRKEEVIEGGHHGGAWKVAYADFVTAMMAFFLLMWLLNATSEEQRRGLADYFSPSATLSHSVSGSGLPFGGRTPFEKGSLVSDRGAQSVGPGRATLAPDSADDDSETSPQERAASALRDDRHEAAPSRKLNTPAEDAAEDQHANGLATQKAGPAFPGGVANKITPDAQAETREARLAEAARQAEAESRERAAFEQAAQQIRDAVRADPKLAELARQLSIDMTPEGLRIQILDEERLPMFATGSAAVNDRARLLLQKVAPVIKGLTEKVSITGHTDAAPFHGSDKSNWELSAERANATRRLLIEAGLDESRIRSVAGLADRDPLLPADPMAAANRRIAIVVLRQAAHP
jgi:chemotaxis protein MotB